MSYDFELYTSRKQAFEQPQTSDGSNIRIDGPDRVEDEDIPANYLAILGKKRVLFRIHLEGNLTSSDHAAVNTWLGKIISETKGVLIDLQTEQFETPIKSGHLAPLRDQSNYNGWMSFYFENGEKFYESGFETMLQEIAITMPEAIPARYGYYEPLQGKVEDGDVSDLVASFKNETDLFMKSKTPFGHIFVSIPCKKTFERYHPRHFIRRKFLLGSVCFELRPKLFAHPEKFDRLKSLFERLCVAFDVVYAEIVQTDDWSGWYWYGLPDNQAHTICVGSAYQDVWPEVLKAGHKVGKHHQLVTTDRFGNKPPRPPKDLVAPEQDDDAIDPVTGQIRDTSDMKPSYAPVFPFDFEFDLNKYIW